MKTAMFLITAVALVGCAGPMHSSTDPASAIVPESKIHPVTADMAAEAQAKTSQKLPAIKLKDDRGIETTVADLQKGRPALLYFLNFECPCCVDAHPFFERIATGFGSEIAFIGVMDASVENCRTWKKANKFTGPILADPDRKLIKAAGAKAATYSVVVDKDGTIVKVYPGYQQRQLFSLVDQLASISQFSPATMDFKDAPEELTSGCTY